MDEIIIRYIDPNTNRMMSCFSTLTTPITFEIVSATDPVSDWNRAMGVL